MVDKIRSYNSFAIILLNDEESFRELKLPAELDPRLSPDNFRKVCFICIIVNTSDSVDQSDLRVKKERVFNNLFQHVNPEENGQNQIFASESNPTSYKTLSFYLGMILAKPQGGLQNTLIVCRNKAVLE